MAKDFSIRYVSDDRDFEIVFDIRRKVFQDELGLTEEEDLDGHDHIAHHYLILDGLNAIGTGRWRITPAGNVRIERIAIIEGQRGFGAGSHLVTELLKQIPTGLEVKIEASTKAMEFWKLVGFVPLDEPYLESGIAHQTMILLSE